MGIIKEGIKGTLEGIGSLAVSLRSAITGDLSPEKKAELEKLILEIEAKAIQGQLEINKQEAAHPSLFVAGWRPFIGWVCGIALAYNYIIRDMLIWASQYFQVPMPPELGLETLMTLLLAMLGVGGMRSFEKTKGVSRETWGNKNGK